MKRKEATKAMAAALAATMAIGMTGCGGNGDSSSSAPSSSTPSESKQESTPAPEETTPSTEEEAVGAYTLRKDENGNVYDLDGMEVIIRDWWYQETEPQNAMDEAREEYLDWAQETYHFTVKRQAISTWADVPTDFVNYATAGDDNNYLFVLRTGAELQAAMDAELMYDLATLDCLDFSEPKWVSGVHNLYSKNGKIYCMRGEEPEPRGGIFFNKRLLTEAGIDPEQIYELQENMEWTWDKFEELCEQIYADTDNDGVIDRWPIITFNDSFYNEAVFSNNGDYVGMENGKYVNKLESAETLDALNWARSMLTKYRKPDPEGANWDYWATGFINGEAAFLADEAYNAAPYNPEDTSAGKWAAMKDDFGFVCFPMGPKASDYTNIYNDNVFAIPACYDADRAWKIAFVYDLYTEPTPGFEDQSASLSSYYSKFRDMESVDYTIKRMLTNGRVTYHSLIGGLDMGNDLLWKFQDDNTPAQQAEAIRNTWDAYIAKANGDITDEQLQEIVGTGDETEASE